MHCFVKLVKVGLWNFKEKDFARVWVRVVLSIHEVTFMKTLDASNEPPQIVDNKQKVCHEGFQTFVENFID